MPKKSKYKITSTEPVMVFRTISHLTSDVSNIEVATEDGWIRSIHIDIRHPESFGISNTRLINLDKAIFNLLTEIIKTKSHAN